MWKKNSALTLVFHFAIRWFLVAMLGVMSVIGLTACKKSPPLPNPVEKKDGQAYIPIDDTAFLIPEKTWLVGFGRNSTDGMVSSITLHATVPDVQPWSQERHEEMYWPAGPGKKLTVYLNGDSADQISRFYSVPRSVIQSFDFIEENSDQAAQGLRRFRRLWGQYSEEAAKKALTRYGQDFVDEMRRDAGKPMMDNVYYELIEHDRVKYLIYCSDDRGGALARLPSPFSMGQDIDGRRPFHPR